jgi:hypothetical protein
MEAEGQWGRRYSYAWYALGTLAPVGSLTFLALRPGSLADRAIPGVLAVAVLVIAVVRLRQHVRRDKHTPPS